MKPNNQVLQIPMSRSCSFFLDVLRIAAALFVFIFHCIERWNYQVFLTMAPAGHSAVIVFFVLSGYVIAYSTFSKKPDIKGYAVARLARLYSVLLPALVLTWLLQIIGHKVNPAFYNQISRGSDITRLFMASIYVQNLWFLSTSPPTNVPLWSLSYEFWYYTLFGAAALITSQKTKRIVLLLLIMLVGPNILLLMPCWLVGVACFTYGAKHTVKRHFAVWGLLLSLVALVLIVKLMPDLPVHLIPVRTPLLWSGKFFTDWFFAFSVGSIIFFFNTLQLNPPSDKVYYATRYAADLTFSLYIYHSPLLLLAIASTTAVSHLKSLSFAQTTCVSLLVLLCVVIMAHFTEGYRGFWKKCFAELWDKVALHKWR